MNEFTCEQCDSEFTVHTTYGKIEFCPLCGADESNLVLDLEEYLLEEDE